MTPILVQITCCPHPLQASKQQQLIDKLEEDLVASRGSTGASRGGKAGAPGARLSGLVGGDSVGEGLDDAEGGSGQDSSVLRVLCSQRDR